MLEKPFLLLLNINLGDLLAGWDQIIVILVVIRVCYQMFSDKGVFN